MPGGDYTQKRIFYQDISGNLILGTGTDDTTLVTARTASHTVFIQKAHIQITGASNGKTWQLVDSASTPVQITGPFPTDTDGSHYDMDFGPVGVPLTEGKNLVVDVSAAGAAGVITWEGYSRITSAIAAGSA
jgi:hypothetical protein